MPKIRRPENMRMTLKTARELAGLTQTEAAALIGVTPDTIGNYERGKSYPDIPVLRKIEEAYGVSYNNLIFLPLDFGLTGKTTHEEKKDVQ